MLTLVSDRKEPLTIEATRKFANGNGMLVSPGERSYEPSRTQWLKNKFYEGTLYAPVWATFRFRNDPSHPIRVNGQHSSAMFAQIPKDDFPQGRSITLHEWEGDTHDDLVACFQQYDQRNSARTTNDTYWAHRAQFSELVGAESLTRSKLGMIVDGLSFFYSKVMRVRQCRNADERGKLVAQHPDFVLAVVPMIESKHMKGRTIIAAMLATHIKSSTSLDKFWSLVRDGSHADHEHPTRSLNKRLIAVAAMTQEQRAKEFTYHPDGLYHACIHAWNAVRRNQKTALRVYKDKDYPEPV